MPKTQTADCGCVVTTDDEGKTSYAPCLVCALHQAGQMLQAASARLRERAQDLVTTEDSDEDPLDGRD